MKIILLILLFLIKLIPNQNKSNDYDLLIKDYDKSIIEILEGSEIYFIAEAIGKIESNSNYKAIGKNGEIGKYQFLPSTWVYLSKKYFGYVKEPTNGAQDTLAYLRVIELMKKKYTYLEIASIWNCNSPKWEGKEGYNKDSVYYNVPLYIKKFEKAYSELIARNKY